MRKSVAATLFLIVASSAAVIWYYRSIQSTTKITTRSNTHISDPVTTFDFVPLGVTLVQHPNGSLYISENQAKVWYVNNFVPFGMGTTADGKHSIIYHNNLIVSSTGIEVARYKVSVDEGEWIVGRTDAPVYYDETGTKFDTGFPTVYVEQGNFFAYIAYDEDTRTWYYKLNSPDGYINATAKARSVPFWMGKADGPYVVHGLYVTHEDLDLWGGYVDMADLITESDFGGVERTYYGTMAMDREYHRQLHEGGEPGRKGCFTAMSLHTDEIDMALIQAINPIDGSDNYGGVKFEHQGRINFFAKGKDFTFNDFQYGDDGGIPPQSFRVEGSYEGGYITLTATTFQTWDWSTKRATWWNENVSMYWGRCFVLWNGEITLNGETIKIEDAFGFGEGTRVD